MNKRQMKKMRQLRLENERLREAQQVRLETAFALQGTNERVDDLHEELCKLRQVEMANMRTTNQLVDQQEHLCSRYKEWQQEAREIRASHMGLNRRVSDLENNNSLIRQWITAGGIWLILIMIIAVVMI